MKTDPYLLFQWREAVMSDMGPSSPITRYVLLTLSMRMDIDGRGAYPSQTTLSEMTKLAKRTVNEHLQLAEKEGWIARLLQRRKARIWHNHRYEVRFPAFLQHAKPKDKVTETHLVEQESAVDNGSVPVADKVIVTHDKVTFTT